MRVILAIVFLSLLMSCSSHTSTCQLKDNSFEQFLARWVIDSTFSLDRTIYPLKQVNFMAGEEGTLPEITFLSREKLSISSLQDYQNADGLKHKTKMQTNTYANVSVFKPDTDWLYEYIFIKSDGCWYLKEINDYSG